MLGEIKCFTEDTFLGVLTTRCDDVQQGSLIGVQNRVHLAYSPCLFATPPAQQLLQLGVEEDCPKSVHVHDQLGRIDSKAIK
jgi:hypothetical protein